MNLLRTTLALGGMALSAASFGQGFIERWEGMQSLRERNKALTATGRGAVNTTSVARLGYTSHEDFTGWRLAFDYGGQGMDRGQSWNFTGSVGSIEPDGGGDTLGTFSLGGAVMFNEDDHRLNFGLNAFYNDLEDAASTLGIGGTISRRFVDKEVIAEGDVIPTLALGGTFVSVNPDLGPDIDDLVWDIYASLEFDRAMLDADFSFGSDEFDDTWMVRLRAPLDRNGNLFGRLGFGESSVFTVEAGWKF